jgi:DNA polymerase elongation subunit (family B)
VITKEAKSLRSKITKLKTRFYIVNFNKPPEPQPDQQEPPPEQPPPTEPPQQPPTEPSPQPQPSQPSPLELSSPEPIKPEPPQQEPTDEIDDSLVEAFSRTTYEGGKPQKPKEDEEKEKAPQPKEKKKSQKAKPKAKEAVQPQPPPEEKAQDNKIIINEDELNIYDIKPREEIPKFTIEQKDLVPFSELVIGCVDIETTGREITDEILAISFNVYKGDELLLNRVFYLDECNNDEAVLVSKFLDALSKSDIDVLTGYNIYSFDLPRIQSKDLSNRLRFSEPVNVSGVFIKNQIQQGYKIIVDNIEIDTIDAYYLVLKYDSVARSIPEQNYKLKNVAKYFGIAKEDRVILTVDEIRECYKTDRKRFNDYVTEDVREAYEVFRKLAPAYYYIRSIVPFNLSFFDAYRLSTAAIWERILEYYYGKDYTQTLTSDEKKVYSGGLVDNHEGLYKNVYKIDVTSLYPNIMLNYHIHSHKDKNKIALSILNEYTNLRLQLKKKAKEGDKTADLIQGSLKILINSLYGFYGADGFLFNDMNAAATVTAYGRKILKTMIEYVEVNGGTIIECDTDGIFFSAVNGEEIYNGLRQELNRINFDIELEYKDCVMFASDKKNYILIKQDGTVIKKGSKYAGRDKNKLKTEFVVEYIKRYIEDPTEAEAYKQEMLELIKSGKAYDWLKVTKKVAKNETRIILDGLRKGLTIEPGSIVTCAYENFRNGRYTFDSEEEKAYDVDYYVKEFQKLVDEIDGVIGRC